MRLGERKGEEGKRILPRSRPAEEEAAGREWEGSVMIQGRRGRGSGQETAADGAEEAV